MTTMTLVEARPEPETNLARLVEARAWARDLACVGGASGLAISLLMGASASFVLSAALAAAAIGAAIGAGAPLLLSRRVRRIPVVLLLAASAGLGANWGAATGAIAALASGEPGWLHAAELGATAGLVLLGAFWLPAALLRARGRSTGVVVLGAIALCPVIAAYLALVW